MVVWRFRFIASACTRVHGPASTWAHESLLFVILGRRCVITCTCSTDSRRKSTWKTLRQLNCEMFGNTASDGGRGGGGGGPCVLLRGEPHRHLVDCQPDWWLIETAQRYMCRLWILIAVCPIARTCMERFPRTLSAPDMPHTLNK